MSTLLAEFHLIRPAALLLLPVVVGAWWLWRRIADPLRGWRGQIAPELLAALVADRAPSARGRGLVRLAAWILAVIAVAGPTWQPEPSPFADDAAPLVLLLRADASMETPDPAPSRLERARLKIADLADARGGQPLGLVAYAGSAHLVLPPTRDTAVVAGMAAEIGPAIMPVPGDRLDLALRRAGAMLDGAGGTIVVLADTVDVDPATLETVRGASVQFLALAPPGTPEDDRLRAAASALGARVQPLTPDDEDVAGIVRRAARAPRAEAGEGGARWQEAGYWLTPVIVLLCVPGFRRTMQEPSS